MPIYYIPKELFKIILVKKVKKYIEATVDQEMKVLLALAWLTGSRIIELIELNRANVLIDYAKKDITITIKARKFGKIGYPSFSFDDPFVSDIVMPYLESKQEDENLFTRGKRRYQQLMLELNKKLNPDDKREWLTFHYFRHSRLTHMGRILRAFPEEFKSWTGHRSSAFEEYFAPRRVDRFKGKLGEGID